MPRPRACVYSNAASQQGMAATPSLPPSRARQPCGCMCPAPPLACAYSSCLASWMSAEAPLPNASSMPASFFTRLHSGAGRGAARQGQDAGRARQGGTGGQAGGPCCIHVVSAAWRRQQPARWPSPWGWPHASTLGLECAQAQRKYKLLLVTRSTATLQAGHRRAPPTPPDQDWRQRRPLQVQQPLGEGGGARLHATLVCTRLVMGGGGGNGTGRGGLGRGARRTRVTHNAARQAGKRAGCDPNAGCVHHHGSGSCSCPPTPPTPTPPHHTLLKQKTEY